MIPSRYNLEKAVYKNARTKVTLTCLHHGDFDILPRDIVRRSYLCKACKDEFSAQGTQQNAEAFAERVREKFGADAFDLSELGYQDTQSLVTLVCQKHQTRHQIRPYDLDKLTYGCTDCRNEALREKYTAPPAQFLEKAKAIHGDRYDYGKVNYQGSHHKVTIECRVHGEFEQTPASHLSGRGCPKCGVSAMASKKKRQ